MELHGSEDTLPRLQPARRLRAVGISLGSPAHERRTFVNHPGPPRLAPVSKQVRPNPDAVASVLDGAIALSRPRRTFIDAASRRRGGGGRVDTVQRAPGGNPEPTRLLIESGFCYKCMHICITEYGWTQKCTRLRLVEAPKLADLSGTVPG